jgi:hypothetical protein
LASALLEGAAFFGLSVLMVAATHGILLSVPWLWINLVPVAVLLILIAYTFPTGNTMKRIFESSVLQTSTTP